ncbi:MAG: family phosphoesterase, partial [Solirubrobacterales bacterium]|nr:family phosphoesterase [Solirubrobacterales bacterium]
VLLGRGQTPWGPHAPVPPGPLAILDWGVRPLDRPALLVDHHVPESEPGAQQTLLSGHGEEPETTTAALMRRLVPEAPAWLAAVGTVGDLGTPGFALPEATPAPKTAVRELVALVNAPRRLAEGPVRTALALLVEHDEPKAALADPRIEELREAKRAWKAELDRVIRTPPVVGPAVALLRFRSSAQVHPLVATTWARRLAPRVVVAANDDYLPGYVNFAMRGGEGSLLDLLRAALPEGFRGEAAHGHPRATGGSLRPADFALTMARLGVPAAPRH